MPKLDHIRRFAVAVSSCRLAATASGSHAVSGAYTPDREDDVTRNATPPGSVGASSGGDLPGVEPFDST
ncbi:hypothetical protein DYB35_013919, partial [Aphanomyces astaci]